MKKYNNWIWMIIILIALVLFGIWIFENKEGPEPKAEPVIQMELPADSHEQTEVFLENCETEKIVGLHISGEEVIRLYETIARLEAQLAACEEGKSEAVVTKVEQKQSSGRSAAKVSVQKKSTAPAQKAERSRSITEPESSSHSSNPQIAVNQYVGEIIGDFGVTFDGNSKLFFYVKKSLLDQIGERNISDSYLNSKSGAKGQVVGTYVLYKTDQTVLNNMLDNTWQWAAYIGDHNQYNYDMWLPHELVKLNASLAGNGDIKANSMGGYHFLSKMNYKSK
jgi:hypothetical protein